MKAVNVEFKKGGKQYLFYDNDIEILEGNYVIVETERGLQFGKVTKTQISSNDDHALVLRVATDKDERQNEKNIKQASKAVEVAQEEADKLSLSMKFIEAFYTFNQKQLVFYFVSENRVDFRELAKRLASEYKTRIELRQVGVRDKAKEVSGIGPCGRKLCCSCFLNDLDSVGISMVKNQNLALNPTKINGLCGRLLCCLKYEDDIYTENRLDMPNVGDKVTVQNERGVVTFVDIPNRKYKVLTESGNKTEVVLPSKCDRCAKRSSK